jgi:prolyl-tRNA editing enzyme YbaK/EbsC (Cys-tRNA(Pro) deacylase)
VRIVASATASDGRGRRGGAGSPGADAILAAVPDPADHPSIRRVIEAAERKGVALDVRVFDASTHTAEDAAAAIGCRLAQIVKSLVFVAPSTDGPRPVVCLVSGTNRVDLARLAAVTGEPDIRRATAREATELTGFVIGGIPPFGHPRPVRVIMDPDLSPFGEVWAAAGIPTAVFGVSPGVLRTLANAHVAPIAAAPEVSLVTASGATDPAPPTAA